LQVLDDDMRNRFLGGRKRILAWIGHFEEAHVFLLEVKAQMQSKAAAAATAAKQGGSEASSELKFSSKL
jgi:glutathione S-transferase